MEYRKEALDAAMAYDRLKENDDFKKIVDFYTKTVAVDYAKMYAFNGIDETMRKEAAEKMTSCYNFEAYLQELENAVTDMRSNEDE